MTDRGDAFVELSLVADMLLPPWHEIRDLDPLENHLETHQRRHSYEVWRAVKGEIDAPKI